MNSNAARGRQQHRVKYEPPPHYFVHRTNDRRPELQRDSASKNLELVSRSFLRPPNPRFVLLMLMKAGRLPATPRRVADQCAPVHEASVSLLSNLITAQIYYHCTAALVYSMSVL